MIWKTRITKITKTKYPLIMAAFWRHGITEFAASFSNAGGFGTIAALNYDIKNFKNELQKMKELTDKPFGVNITVDRPRSGANAKAEKEEYLKYIEVAINEGVEIFTTSSYQALYIGERVHEAGCYWFPKVPLLKHAISVENAGADAITLMGMESSGYKNPFQHSTLVNITMGKKILKTPIIAAGGLGDARGFLGALTMGAEAICLGTAILVTKESPLPPIKKESWVNTDIFSKDYHKRLYHLKLGGTSVPSPAVAYKNKIVSLKELIENIMINAENILKSLGFPKDEFNTMVKR
ncbi:MAG: NAD(P)H-dependent flavin oxidoreductase [Promethearchaeota archaeon]|jgi:NAD(P)H-dependent flavin oxidoreductase YrpB (nitropropane dioxygenase family)